MAFQSIPRERIIEAISKLGPAQPLEVRRELGEGDTVLIGAILSEMAHTGLIAISRTKRGGSPFYYLPKQPETLESISQWLNEKDRKTFEILKYHKVLREDKLDPLTRVSLQNIPDFSRRFTVQTGDMEVAYWRYFLISEEQARNKIAPPKPERVERQERLPEEPQINKDRPKKKTAPKTPGQNWIQEDSLYAKIERFAEKQSGELSEQNCIKPEGEITSIMEVDGTYGPTSYYLYAVSRKTLPAHMVFKQLLEARSKGLPLLVLKDSEYPKSIFKKFDDVPNVFFRKI